MTLLLVLTPLVMLSHISWSQEENGLLFNVDGRDVDFIGIMQDKWRITTARCDAVRALAHSDPQFSEIKKLIQSYSPPNSVAIKTMAVWTSGTWAVAELEFEDLLPAVVTVKNMDQDATIFSDGVWSGMTTPWKSGPFIRAYLGKRTPEMPTALLNCFELRSASFDPWAESANTAP
jgi:hypothetical protein